MKNESMNVKIVTKKAVCAAAALAATVFVSSNAIAYAATGSTWVDKVKVSLGGKEYDAKIVKKDENTMEVEISGDEDKLPNEISISSQ